MPVWAVSADSHATLERALDALRPAGHTVLEILSPYPTAADEPRSSRLTAIAGGIGIAGAGAGYLLQWYCTRAYPIRVSGIDPDAWLPYLPISFESGVLACCLATVVLLLVRLRLPRLHMPAERYTCTAQAQADRFVAVLRGPDPGATLQAAGLPGLRCECLAEDGAAD